MKTYESIIKQLEKDGMRDIGQGSEEWLTRKLGVISASKADKILMGRKTQGRNDYMCELVGQIVSKEMPEPVSSKILEWGHFNEPAARSALEFDTGLTMREVPFVYKDETRRCLCSPDALVVDAPIGVELKAPWTTRVYIDFVCNGKIKKEYIAQCQFSMWVTDYPAWIFACYDPRCNGNMFHAMNLIRDEEMMKKFDEKIPEFIEDMDEMLDKLGLKFGDQWK